MQAQPAVEEAKSSLDWSDLESRLGELARFSSEHSSEPSSRLAVEPHVTLAHDPHDPLAILEQLNARYRSKSAKPQPVTDQEGAADRSGLSDRTDAVSRPKATEGKQDPFDILSYLASIPSKQS
jgi:hypothetical protein